MGPFESNDGQLGIKKLFEGRLMVTTVSHGQVDKKCGVFGLWHLCFLRGGPRSLNQVEDRWLSECQGQNSSFSVFERARASRAREFEATAGNALLLLLQSSPPFLLGLILALGLISETAT